MPDSLEFEVASALETAIRDMLARSADPAALLRNLDRTIAETLLSPIAPRIEAVREMRNRAVIAAAFDRVMTRLQAEY